MIKAAHGEHRMMGSAASPRHVHEETKTQLHLTMARRCRDTIKCNDVFNIKLNVDGILIEAGGVKQAVAGRAPHDKEGRVHEVVVGLGPATFAARAGRRRSNFVPHGRGGPFLGCRGFEGGESGCGGEFGGGALFGGGPFFGGVDDAVLFLVEDHGPRWLLLVRVRGLTAAARGDGLGRDSVVFVINRAATAPEER
ncbi:Aste57867_2713 [Aphanomyces stellatus]|nr:hypothetical protein As57867_002706 [Aphanomyces stellatus]VFT79906.1 Aste57867_2713 [Aphanomyces stellatus]